MNYLHWNLVVHVRAPRNFVDLKIICLCLWDLSKDWARKCWRRLRLIHAARERTGWMTPTQSVVLNEERDTALLCTSERRSTVHYC